MRCKCCDSNLNDFESTRKHAETKEYLDICDRCFRWMEDDIPVEVRDDLNPLDEVTDDNFGDEDMEYKYDDLDED